MATYLLSRPCWWCNPGQYVWLGTYFPVRPASQKRVQPGHSQSRNTRCAAMTCICCKTQFDITKELIVRLAAVAILRRRNELAQHRRGCILDDRCECTEGTHKTFELWSITRSDYYEPHRGVGRRRVCPPSWSWVVVILWYELAVMTACQRDTWALSLLTLSCDLLIGCGQRSRRRWRRLLATHVWDTLWTVHLDIKITFQPSRLVLFLFITA